MDIQPQQQQPISDDQELAKVLAGITASADPDPAASVPVPPAPTTTLADDLNEEASATDTPKEEALPEAPQAPPVPEVEMPVPNTPVEPSPMSTNPTSGNLESIKNDALHELRPLVDKLNISPEEKFDTYLLLLRSTDDETLVAPAFESARTITDESTKAQALLDIVKEIDYLSNPNKQQSTQE